MSLRHQVERAFKAVIEAIPDFPTDKVTVYRGQDFAQQQVPCVVCWCKGGDEEPKGSGNHFMVVTVAVKTRAVDNSIGDGSDLNPVDSIDQLSSLVFNGLAIGDITKDDDPDGLAAKLSAAEDNFTAFHPVIETGYDPDLAEYSFIDTRTFKVFCCDGDIALV